MHRLSPPLYIKALYIVGPMAALLLALQIELHHLKTAFYESSALAVQQIQARVSSFELALEGFANFLSVSPDISDQQIRAYTQGVRKLYPELYMFEVARRIADSQREDFEASMRAKGYDSFAIHGFDYEGNRQVTQVSERPYYYPIRFIEPETTATVDVLGLDLGSTSTLLSETLTRSLITSRPIASRPFELIEGGKGYVIYRPVKNTAFKPQDFAMLVIRAGDLIPAWLLQHREHAISLSYQQAIPTPHKQTLIEPASGEREGFIKTALTTYQHRATIDSDSQPFELVLERSVHWSDLNPFWFTLVTLSGSLISFYWAKTASRSYNQKAAARKKHEELYQQAHFDALTGLPNINLFYDRGEQAIHRAHRNHGKVGICYLDLDQFKRINDTWGHRTGDEVLKEIANRLAGCLRDEDSAARIHGDEFVILLPDISDKPALDRVAEKILSEFIRPFNAGEQEIDISSSIGTAIYPDDADDLESLLNISDQMMYAHKRSEINADSHSHPFDPATRVYNDKVANSGG